MAKRYDLEERTYSFAQEVRDLIMAIPRNPDNEDYLRQLGRSSASVGANYIEANESLSRKDYINRVKICRKEVKESRYWLNLIDNYPEKEKKIKNRLVDEATQLLRIFNKCIVNSSASIVSKRNIKSQTTNDK